jgi:hypothetical protein
MPQHKAIAAIALLCALNLAQAEVVLSALTLDGTVMSVPTADTQSPLTRRAIAEDGRRIIVDEFAVIADAGRPVFASEAFEANRMPTIAQISHSLAEESQLDSNIRSRPLAVLVVQHQRHDINANFAPTPVARFEPRTVSARELAGQRGFAVITVGESGQIREVKTLTDHGLISNAKLRRTLASGTKITFEDDRRHDHTVYLAYEIQGQTVMQVGTSLVTLPMCVCP